uniref:IQ motif containing N n=1 Tax=Felis catus TaxID=9685 RepID=A0ABI8ASS4_FELCA
MQQATQPQLSPNGQSLYQPQSDPNLQDKARTLRPKPQHEPLGSKESLPQDLDKDKKATHHIPRLRAVVESQAFKNILVDEMDMMLSRAATLIQANWRGYRLRQKLISQMTAAKAIQEAWRHFNTKRLLRSGKSVEKKVSVEEGDIPYHPPQQVRFQHPGESKSPLAQPIMVSKETQFPSSDSLAACTHQLVLLQTQSTPQPGIRVPCTIGGPNVTFLPHQTVAIRLPCPVSLDAKCRPCLLTRTVRNSCLVHVEGDTVKTKQGTARASKSGASGPPPPVRSAPAVHGSLKTQTQDHMEAEVFKAPPQTGPAPVITKTPPQPCVVPTGTVAKAPPQMYPAARMTKTPTPMYPAAAMTKTPLQSCLAAMMNKTPPQPCSTPTATITKTPPQMYQAALRTGVVLPKATSQTAGSRMTMMPTPVEVGSPSAAWGPTLGLVRPQPSKGPADAVRAGGQARNSAVPSGAVGPVDGAVTPGGPWEPARASVPGDTVGREAAVNPRQPGKLMASMQVVEKIIIRAVVIIQARTRGYLARRAIKAWHQWAVIIQAAWRGYRVRRDLARLSRAATVIQAVWRGFCIRRGQTPPALLQGVWAEMGGRTGWTSDHRCFQSCQPHVCPLCQSLSPRAGSPPSVVMLVGSSPRTCHMCGHTLPTRVVHGMGRGARVQAGVPWGSGTQTIPGSPRQSRRQSEAAATIQSAWRGFSARRQLRQKQVAAKTLQATWRGHHTRATLTTDALLGPAAWDDPQYMQWPGV